jgi:hypothetical protein
VGVHFHSPYRWIPPTAGGRLYSQVFWLAGRGDQAGGSSGTDHSEQLRRAWRGRKAAGADNYFAGVCWTDAELLEALRQLHKQHGYVTANLIDQNGATPSAYYYAKRSAR